MTATDPTYLGHVSAVSGSTITVKLAESLSSGLAMIDGHTYRVGQVGSFVRIPLGYQDLYGVVAEIGAAAAPNLRGCRCRWPGHRPLDACGVGRRSDRRSL